MTGDAVERIADLARISANESTIEIGGQTYTTRQLSRVKFDPVIEDGLLVYTLSAFVEILNREFDGTYTEEELLVIVENERSVQVVTKPMTEDLKRSRPLRAEMLKTEEFPFGHWIDLEAFVIKLASLFEPTPDRDAIAAYVRKVDVTEQMRYADDGVTQVAEVKRGASGAVTDSQEAKSIARLKPYRTFREVVQPESEFLFRLKTGDGKVGCALFEAEGGAWRLNAVDYIADYLRQHLTVGVLVVS